MGRRSEHTRQELKALIVEQTLRLVRESGAERVTARRIAEAVDYTPGMLYSIFTSLEEIFLHVNAIGLEALYERCDAARTGEPAKAIESMGLAYLDFSREHEHQFRLMFHPTRETTLPGHAPIVSSPTARLAALVELELERLAPTAAPDARKVAARALWAGVHGVAALAEGSHEGIVDGPAPDATPEAILIELVSRFTDARGRAA